MLLQGSLKEFSLPNIFQLVKMSAKTGALTIRREKEWGKIFFKDGLILSFLPLIDPFQHSLMLWSVLFFHDQYHRPFRW